jgi:hypothetical protein
MTSSTFQAQTGRYWVYSSLLRLLSVYSGYVSPAVSYSTKSSKLRKWQLDYIEANIFQFRWIRDQVH